MSTSIKAFSFRSINDYIELERQAQIEKFGIQNHTDEIWNLILVEEIGEINKAILDDKFKDNSGNLEDEIIQVMAVCKAWLECRYRNNPNNLLGNNH